ncbi:hypothetical protein SEA_MEYRAN_47 [Gordonia phage Meyran]|nr:hypothetical protein SEA_MEYRAN_47 [Gordonia phage Meyran]
MGDEVTVSANPPETTVANVELGRRYAYSPSGLVWTCVAADRPAVLRVEDATAADYDGGPGVAITVRDVEMGGLVDLVMLTVPLSALEAIVDQARARR